MENRRRSNLTKLNLKIHAVQIGRYLNVKSNLKWVIYRGLVSVLAVLGLSSLSWAQSEPVNAVTSATGFSNVKVKIIDWISPISLSLKSEVKNDIRSYSDKGEAKTETQLKILYKLNEAAQVGILVGGKYKFVAHEGIQNKESFAKNDGALVAVFNLAPVLSADKSVIEARFAKGTSETSKIKNLNYMVRADLTLPYSLEDEKFAAVAISSRYKDFELNKKQLEVLTQLKASKGKIWAPYLALNHRFKIDSTSSETQRIEEGLGPEVGLEYNPSKNLKLALGVVQERNVLNPTLKKATPEYKLFDSKETEVGFTAQIKL